MTLFLSAWTLAVILFHDHVAFSLFQIYEKSRQLFNAFFSITTALCISLGADSQIESSTCGAPEEPPPGDFRKQIGLGWPGVRMSNIFPLIFFNSCSVFIIDSTFDIGGAYISSSLFKASLSTHANLKAGFHTIPASSQSQPPKLVFHAVGLVGAQDFCRSAVGVYKVQS